MVCACSDTRGVEREHAPGEALPFGIVSGFGEFPDNVHGEEEFKNGGEVDGPGWDGESIDWFGMHDCNQVMKMKGIKIRCWYSLVSQ